MNQLDRPDVKLRPETERDKEFLLTLYISTRDEELLNIGWSPADIKTFLGQQFEAQTQWYRQLYPNAEYQIIEWDGRPVGRLYSNRDENEYRLIDVALLPAVRNQTLGSFLIQTLQHSALKTGIPVNLHVELHNPAQRLYRRLGFTDLKNDGIHTLMTWSPKQETL